MLIYSTNIRKCPILRWIFSTLPLFHLTVSTVLFDSLTCTLGHSRAHGKVNDKMAIFAVSFSGLDHSEVVLCPYLAQPRRLQDRIAARRTREERRKTASFNFQLNSVSLTKKKNSMNFSNLSSALPLFFAYLYSLQRTFFDATYLRTGLPVLDATTIAYFMGVCVIIIII